MANKKLPPDFSDFIDFSDENLSILSKVEDSDIELAKTKIKQGGLTLLEDLLDSQMKDIKDA